MECGPVIPSEAKHVTPLRLPSNVPGGGKVADKNEVPVRRICLLPHPSTPFLALVATPPSRSAASLRPFGDNP